jgi:hypothetical protein
MTRNKMFFSNNFESNNENKYLWKNFFRIKIILLTDELEL